MRRRSVVGAFLVMVVSGCGSSRPENGLILAWKNERVGGALYVMNSDGSGLRKVPHSDAGPDAWTPDGMQKHRVAKNVPLGAVSPDGRTLAFEADSCAGEGFSEECELTVENPTEIYTIGIDGRGRRRLTHNRSYDGSPSWSPDRKRIAFATDFGPRIMDRDGTNRKAVSKSDWATTPLWSPRGDGLLMMSFGRWSLVSPEGGKQRYLERGPRGPEWGATWSPDGRKIAYLSRRAHRWTAHDRLQIGS